MWILATMMACEPSDLPQQETPQPASGAQQPQHPQHQQPPKPPPRPQGPAVQVDPTFELVGAVSETPRSLVLISLDTVRADRLAVYGGRAETPTLDALAARGARFERAISHFPETALSHWTMLSGILPELHGNVPANRGSRCTVPTLAEIARKSGLPTAAFIGGVTLTDSASGLSRGFDVYDDQFPLDTRDMRRPGREVTRRAVNWMQQQDGPYFTFVHYFDAHFPYTPPPPWDTRYDPDYTGSITGSDADLRPYRDGGREPNARDVEHILALYDGELSELDALIAPVIDAAGEDAIVMVTADHGESFEHGYYFNHRAGLWDSITRVPWLIAGPGVPAGAVVAEQVGLTDVTPTALALMGLPADARVQGASRVGLLQGSGDGASVVYAITDPWMHDFQFSARTMQHKIIERDGSGVAVYDLVEDPREDAPSASGPPQLMAAQGHYQRLIADMKGCQVTLDDAPPMTHRECTRLQALGYVHGDCE